MKTATQTTNTFDCTFPDAYYDADIDESLRLRPAQLAKYNEED